jgi:hypothetical protein
VNLFTQLNLASIATLAEFDGETPPPLSPPTHCTVEYVGNMDIKVTWEAPTANTPDEYYVYRDETKIFETPELYYTDVVEDFEEYCYSVVAVYEQGTSNPSNTSCTAVPFPYQPPTHCVATWIEEEANINNNIMVTWEATAGTAPNLYFVYRDEQKITQTANTFFMDTLHTTGEYCYKIKAIYEESQSNFSNQSCAIIPIIDGIKEFVSKYVIYPNPTTGKLEIRNHELEIISVEMYDVYGKKIHLFTPPLVHSFTITMDISDLSASIYFVKIRTKAGDVVRKVVKQ